MDIDRSAADKKMPRIDRVDDRLPCEPGPLLAQACAAQPASIDAIMARVASHLAKASVEKMAKAEAHAERIRRARQELQAFRATPGKKNSF